MSIFLISAVECRHIGIMSQGFREPRFNVPPYEAIVVLTVLPES